MISCSRMSWMRGSTSPRVGRRVMRPSGGSAPVRSRKSGIGGGLSCRFSLTSCRLRGLVLDGDRVAGLEQHAGDVAMLAVEHDVAVATSWRARGPVGREAEAMDDVVQPALHDAQQLPRRCSPASARPARSSGGTGVRRRRRSVSASASRAGGCRTRSACRGGSRACRAATLRRSMAHLGLSQRLPLRKSLMPSRRHSLANGSSCTCHGSSLMVCSRCSRVGQRSAKPMR